jgi:hypothetical protein
MKILGIFALVASFGAQAEELLQGFAFSSARPQAAFPADWREVKLSGVPPVRYSLMQEQGVTVLRAESNAAMSSLARRIDVDPAHYPRLRWRWKISTLIERSDMRSKSGDDFPARVYVSFQYDISRLSFLQRSRLRIARALHGADVPAAVLCYVWDRLAPRGTIVASPYTDRVRVVVATSGPRAVGEWIEVERNLVDDYRAAFGEAPARVDGIALATDTDNTRSQAVSYFGDIAFLAASRR